MSKLVNRYRSKQGSFIYRSAMGRPRDLSDKENAELVHAVINGQLTRKSV